MTIVWTICPVLGSLKDLCRSFLKCCTPTYKVVGLYDGPCPTIIKGDRVLILFPSDCQSGFFQPAYSFWEVQLTLTDVIRFFTYNIYNINVCVLYVLWPPFSPLTQYLRILFNKGTCTWHQLFLLYFETMVKFKNTFSTFCLLIHPSNFCFKNVIRSYEFMWFSLCHILITHCIVF